MEQTRIVRERDMVPKRLMEKVKEKVRMRDMVESSTDEDTEERSMENTRREIKFMEKGKEKAMVNRHTLGPSDMLAKIREVTSLMVDRKMKTNQTQLINTDQLIIFQGKQKALVRQHMERAKVKEEDMVRRNIEEGRRIATVRAPMQKGKVLAHRHIMQEENIEKDM